MKSIRIIFPFLLIVCLALTLSASKPTLQILEIAWTQSGVVEKAFRDELKKLGYKIEVQTYSARQDRSGLAKYLREKVKPNLDKYDYVYSFGTTASLTVKTFLNGRVPQLFNAVTDPVGSGLVKSIQRPGGNISGFSDGIPVEAQIDHVKKFQKIASLALVFNPKESNSNLERRKLVKYCEDFGLKFHDIRMSSTKNRYKETLRKIKKGHWPVDLAVLPQDSFIATNQGPIVNAFKMAKINTLGTQPDYYNAGATYTVTPDYGRGSKALAHILHQHRQGIPLGQIPVATVKKPKILLNK